MSQEMLFVTTTGNSEMATEKKPSHSRTTTSSSTTSHHHDCIVTVPTLATEPSTLTLSLTLHLPHQRTPSSPTYLTRSPISPSLPRSLTHSLTHPLTHSLPPSLTHSPISPMAMKAKSAHSPHTKVAPSRDSRHRAMKACDQSKRFVCLLLRLNQSERLLSKPIRTHTLLAFLSKPIRTLGQAIVKLSIFQPIKSLRCLSQPIERAGSKLRPITSLTCRVLISLSVFVVVDSLVA